MTIDNLFDLIYNDIYAVRRSGARHMAWATDEQRTLRRVAVPARKGIATIAKGTAPAATLLPHTPTEVILSVNPAAVVPRRWSRR